MNLIATQSIFIYTKLQVCGSRSEKIRMGDLGATVPAIEKRGLCISLQSCYPYIPHKLQKKY